MTTPPRSVVRNHDLIAGTSMGGFFAARIGARTGTPFAAANPCIEPKTTLQQYTQPGSPLLLQQEILDAYPDFSTNGCGVILLDGGDEVIDAKRTSELLDPHYRVVTFPGGNHRFTHMKQSLSHIKTMLDNADLVYGGMDGE